VIRVMEATLSDNVFVFILLSVVNTFFSLRLPEFILDYKNWLYQERKWEDGGKVYQRIFKVKNWKNELPELSDFLKPIFPRKHITAFDEKHIQKYLLESCRAELTHWGIILSSFLFGIWSGFLETLFMIFLALGLNLPYVIIQRYNRPRIIRFLENSKGNRVKNNQKKGKNRMDMDKTSGCPPYKGKTTAADHEQGGNIVFLSAEDTGQGHKSITKALVEQAHKRYPEVKITVIDGFSLGGKFMDLMGRLYNPIIVNFPALWGFFYWVANRHPRIINAFVTKSIEKELIRRLKEIRPEMIVPVHAVFIGAVLNVLKRENINIPVIPLIADLDNVSSMWADERSAYTLCPSVESKRTMLSLGIPEEKLQLVDFPVREDFCEPFPAAPRESDQIAKNGVSVLLVNGSQGSKRNMSIIRNILDRSNCRISILAGSKVSLKERLEKEFGDTPGHRVQIHGFTKDMKRYMTEADILIVRGSPNVVMEAVNLCKPIIVVDALRGQEEKNPEYVQHHNLGVVCMDPQKVPDVISDLLAQNGKKLREIYDRQLTFRNIRAAQEIVEFIVKHGCKTMQRPAGVSQSETYDACVLDMDKSEIH